MPMVQTKVERVSLSESPAPVRDWFGNLLCFHQGAWNDGTLWYSKLSPNKDAGPEGAKWEGDVRVPKTVMSGSPSAILWGDYIYVFHKGSRFVDELWYNRFARDGTWMGDRKVNDTTIQGSPSVVVQGFKLWVSYRSNSGDGRVCYNTSSDGLKWDGQDFIPNTAMTGSPSAATYIHQLGNIWVVYPGASDSNTLYFTMFEGSWSEPRQVSGVETYSDPFAICVGVDLNVYYQSKDGTTWLCGKKGEDVAAWYPDDVHGAWFGDRMNTPRLSNHPGVTVMKKLIYIFYQGPNSSRELWYFTMFNTYWEMDKYQ